MYSLTQLEESLKKAYRAVTEGKFGDGLTRFTALLHTIPLLVVDTRKEVDDVKELISIAKCALAPASRCPRPACLTRLCRPCPKSTQQMARLVSRRLRHACCIRTHAHCGNDQCR